MKKSAIILIIFLFIFLLIGCSNENGQVKELKEIVNDHNINNYEEVDFEIDILSKLNFQDNKKHLLYAKTKLSTLEHYDDKIVNETTEKNESYFIYTYLFGIFDMEFSGQTKYEYKQQRSKEKAILYSYDVDATYKNDVFAVNVKSIKPNRLSTIKENGKYKTNKEYSIVKFQLHIEQTLRTEIEYYILNPKEIFKLYKDSNNNYLIRKDNDDIIWSIKFDKDFNVLSFYNYAANNYTQNINENQKNVFDNFYESYIVFDTNINLDFDYSNYKEVDTLTLI